MITSGTLRIRIFFALLADAISRTFNYLRIVFFVSLLLGIVIAAWRTDHMHDGTWLLDAAAGGVIAMKLARWLRIET